MLLAPLSRSVVHKASRALLVTRCQLITCCCRAPELARGSYSKVTGVDLAHFRSIVGNNMLTDTTDMQPNNTDWLRTRQGKSAVVLRPHTTCQILEYCNDRNNGRLLIDLSSGVVFGLGIPIIILIVIAVIVYYKLYKTKPGRKRIKRGHSEELLENTEANGDIVKEDIVKEDIVRETVFNRPKVEGIALASLPGVVSDMHENNNAGFTAEYETIQQDSPALSQSHAYLESNMEKNRYRNILPFNDTRVLLRSGGKNNTFNYINADYIDGYSGKRTYIAAQGPLPNTVTHFWQMAWEQKIEVIVMLTALVEGGKRKCTQYWPEPQDGKLTYGNVEVQLIEETGFPFYVLRKFQISQRISNDNATMSSRKRQVMQYAFTQWPDFGVPSNPQSMLRFVRMVRDRLPSSTAPVLVHCSAGVGRTGTFITMDVMLQKLANQQALNIHEFVLGMRYQRTNMVQTERQYVFLYDSLLEAYLYGNTAVQGKGLKRQVWLLTQENQQTGITGMEEEFNHLPPCEYSEQLFTTALSQQNLRKNRDKTYIPFDFNRIVVGESEEYINAVAVQGYGEEIDFIATQHPLINTIKDFWTMVCEQNAKVIVMLGELKSTKDSYWKTQRHPVTIIKEENKDHYTVTHIKIEKPVEHTVIHYLFKAWSSERITPTRKSIISLLKDVQSANEPGCSIVVHTSCSLPVESSGAYCALSMCLDSLNYENYVDVFQTVRSLREQRPYILYSKELYKFVYLVLVDFMQNYRAN